MNSQLFCELDRLQTRQLEHDRLAHQQVQLWPYQRRMTHFTLHFAKYQATLLAGNHRRDSVDRQRVLTDSLIIVMAAANALGIRLADRASAIAGGITSTPGNKLTLSSYVSAVGLMAKACEAMDHGESFDYNRALATGVVSILSVTVRLAEREGLDLIASTHKRWRDIEATVDALSTSGIDHKQYPIKKSAEFA